MKIFPAHANIPKELKNVVLINLIPLWVGVVELTHGNSMPIVGGDKGGQTIAGLSDPTLVGQQLRMEELTREGHSFVLELGNQL